MTERTTQSNDTLKRVLAIMAHPDDADLTCAGTLAKWIKAGRQVHYVVCTCGDKGTKDPHMTPHRLTAIREEEQLAAARKLGIEAVIFLRHKDGELEATKEFRAEIAMLIRHYKPDIVITHDPWQPYQLHPDHRAVGITVCDAIVAARDHLFLPAQTAIGLEAFEPAEARRILRKLEFHFTPKHGSWLNIAEIELSVLKRQCLAGRIADIETMRAEVHTWNTDRNNRKTEVDWQFRTKDARIKLKRLYPKL